MQINCITIYTHLSLHERQFVNKNICTKSKFFLLTNKKSSDILSLEISNKNIFTFRSDQNKS
ncbi:hypothetical protein RyT2_05790 [Pseudolactococcus yaeyamensis]